MDEAVPVILALGIGLPWIVLHYITKWKTAATITEGIVVKMFDSSNLTFW